MRRPTHALRLVSLLTIVSLSPYLADAAAAGVLDPTGIPVCVAAGVQSTPQVVATGDGAAVVVWRDQRRGTSFSDVYAQSIAEDGSITSGWPANGLLVCETGTTREPRVVPDGSGGVLIFWCDVVAPPHIYGQRILASGAIAPGWPAGGKIVSAAIPDNPPPLGTAASLHDALPDGAGGAYVAWKESSWDPTVLAFVLRVTVDGVPAPGWPAYGLAFYPISGFQPQVFWGELRSDPLGALIHYRSTAGDTYDTAAHVARISAAGSVLASVILPAPPGDFFEGAISSAAAPDGDGGWFASWLHRYAHVNSEVGQHYSSAGSPLWPAPTPAPAYQHVESDGAGGVFFIGTEDGVVGLDVHRWRGDGSTPDGWTPTGVVISRPAAMGAIARSTLGQDLLLVWSEQRAGERFDLRATAVDTAGAISQGLAADGTLVSDTTGIQAAPDIAVQSPTRVLVCWADSRNDNSDIYASRIEAVVLSVGPGPASVAALAMARPWPNPARDRTSVSISLAGGGPARLAVLDVNGRPVGRVERVAPGAAPQRIEVDLAGLVSGVYWLRLDQDGRSTARRFAIVR